MNLQPLSDRVLVKRLESEEKTAGGLFIPDTAKEKPIGQRMYQIQPLGALFVDWLNTDFQEQPENKN